MAAECSDLGFPLFQVPSGGKELAGDGAGGAKLEKWLCVFRDSSSKSTAVGHLPLCPEAQETLGSS